MTERTLKIRATLLTLVVGACGIAVAQTDDERGSVIEAIKVENARLIELRGDIADALNYEKAKVEADRQIGISEQRIAEIRMSVQSAVEKDRINIEQLERSMGSHRDRLAHLSRRNGTHIRRHKSTRKP
jgi:hypothetical protein